MAFQNYFSTLACYSATVKSQQIFRNTKMPSKWDPNIF